MTSYSGISAEQLIKTAFVCTSVTDLDYIFNELESIQCYNRLWYEVVHKCVSSYHHNDTIEFIWNHCEDFEELDKKKQCKILKSIIKHIHNTKVDTNYYELFKTRYMNMYKDCTMSKRKQTKLWRSIKKSVHLNDIYEYYTSINHEQIQIACIALCYCKHKGH